MRYPKDLVGYKSDGAEVLSRDSETKIYNVRCGCGVLFTCSRARAVEVLKGKSKLRCGACWKSASRDLVLAIGNQFTQQGETPRPRTWSEKNAEATAISVERDQLKAQLVTLNALIVDIAGDPAVNGLNADVQKRLNALLQASTHAIKSLPATLY